MSRSKNKYWAFILAMSAVEIALAQTAPGVQQLAVFPESISQIAVDMAGQIYLAGQTTDQNFPVTSNAAFKPVASVYTQGFLVKLDPTGAKILYATILPGLFVDGLAVDDSGNMYVFGDHPEPAPADVYISYPASYPFPISPNAAQTEGYFPTSSILAKFDLSGTLVYSTYFGGAADPYPLGQLTATGAMVIDPSGAVTLCRSTVASDLPTGNGSFQPSPGGGFDSYLIRVSPDGTAFQAATYLGGAGNDYCYDLQLGPDGSLYLFGSTTSRDFPVTPDAVQTRPSPYGSTFVASIDPQLSHVSWSTLGPGVLPRWLAFDGQGNLVIFGVQESENFGGAGVSSWTCCARSSFSAVFDGASRQVTFQQPFDVGENLTQDGSGDFYSAAGAAPPASNATLNAAPNATGNWLARFDSQAREETYRGPVPNTTFASGSPVYVSFDLRNQRLLLAGGLPGTQGAYTGQTLIVAADFSGEQRPLVTQAAGGAWPSTSQLSPGDLIQVEGLGLGPAQVVDSPRRQASRSVSPDVHGRSGRAYDPSTAPPTQLAQTSVYFDGNPAPLISVSSTSVLVLAPPSLVPGSMTSLVVMNDGALSPLASVPVVASNPVILTTTGAQSGQADATNPDGNANSSTDPIGKGQNIRLYATGLGVAGSSGDIAAVTATVGELPARVADIAPAQGRTPGYFQIDVTVPPYVPESDFLLVQIQVNGNASPNGVTISVR